MGQIAPSVQPQLQRTLAKVPQQTNVFEVRRFFRKITQYREFVITFARVTEFTPQPQTWV